MGKETHTGYAGSASGVELEAMSRRELTGGQALILWVAGPSFDVFSFDLYATTKLAAPRPRFRKVGITNDANYSHGNANQQPQPRRRPVKASEQETLSFRPSPERSDGERRNLLCCKKHHASHNAEC